MAHDAPKAVPRVMDAAEAWDIEAARTSQRQRAPPPAFVKATLSYDDFGSTQANSSKLSANVEHPLGNILGGWYRTLTSDGGANPSHQHPSCTTSLPPTTHPSSQPRNFERRNKNNWFIMKAIQSEGITQPPAPSSSLADILARDPPPLQSEEKYTPPVFLEIGPSNRGFAMLQRSGWNEGEALGPNVIRRQSIDDVSLDAEVIPIHKKGKMKAQHLRTVRREVHGVKVEQDVSELRNIDVIDLTLSDSDDGDSEMDGNQDLEIAKEEVDALNLTSTSEKLSPIDMAAYGRKALLTPIATVLKSDRLGIGLKAKTSGPYKASQKRVTHNAAALAIHIKAAEETRRCKKEMGRGHKGFDRQRKREEANRKLMLAYMNS